ncbi:SDR family NAD(P)-dependent oxidoreductase [Actinomadura sp. 7K507]|uniref:SDR family NAD(P)-dependent oxidoreductase n=1 Tax=Actinomadura sp. 7K507 TaxID=2530365 RepID=UPI0010478B8A|nr:SDR family NAD(P)-dependent oxidoreductase [Actinomadura sp. 7K507]TDC84021.1 SDR family NAD(P)-dependent oxidoreductase [Actinomadura sp. 7K507]
MNEATGPLALVTGASSGIGRELAAEFARHGFHVIMAAENEEIATAARDVGEHAEGGTTPVRVDLAHHEGVEELYTAVAATGRPLDAAAINAGVGVGGDFARHNDLADELNLIDLNVRSSVHLAKLILEEMVHRGQRRLLFTSSIAATTPGPYQATYAASKAFLYSFAEALRHELSDTGVTVTAALPGPTDTAFFERAGVLDTKLGQMPKDDPADVARESYQALMAGKHHVITGSTKNRAQVAAAKGMPETAKAKMHARVSEPGSGNA